MAKKKKETTEEQLTDLEKLGPLAMYRTVAELETAIQEYFTKLQDASCTDIGYEVPTITGLALHLGFSDRRSVYDYEYRYMKGEKAGFAHTIKRARLTIEAAYECRLHGNSPTGAIFALKNFSWTDKAPEDDTGDFDPDESFL